MSNWRVAWASLSSLYPPLYRRWRFSGFRGAGWDNISTQRGLEPEVLLLREFMKLPGCFVDVGANNGDYLFAALQVKPGAEVIGIEPIPRLCKLLRRAFPSASIHNLALTDSNGERFLKIPDIAGHTYFTRATLNVDYRETGETGRKLIPVTAKTFDTFWKETGDWKPACIKIDTEGHELSVLKGAVDVLARHRPVLLVEIEQRHHEEDIAGVIGFIVAQGYACHHFDAASRRIKELQGSASEMQRNPGSPRYVNNFFFLPKEGAACFEALAGINALLAARQAAPSGKR